MCIHIHLCDSSASSLGSLFYVVSEKKPNRVMPQPNAPCSIGSTAHSSRTPHGPFFILPKPSFTSGAVFFEGKSCLVVCCFFLSFFFGGTEGTPTHFAGPHKHLRLGAARKAAASFSNGRVKRASCGLGIHRRIQGSGCVKNTDRTLQLVNGGVSNFILVLKKPQIFQMVAKWRSFEEPCNSCRRKNKQVAAGLEEENLVTLAIGSIGRE